MMASRRKCGNSYLVMHKCCKLRLNKILVNLPIFC